MVYTPREQKGLEIADGLQVGKGTLRRLVLLSLHGLARQRQTQNVLALEAQALFVAGGVHDLLATLGHHLLKLMVHGPLYEPNFEPPQVGELGADGA
jgi:hypothetical protein